MFCIPSLPKGHDDTGTPTRLGAQFDPHGEYFVGDIDNVRIYGALPQI
jgi:hypothetical protein